eukprot:666736-Prymnesium_polylepis.1
MATQSVAARAGWGGTAPAGGAGDADVITRCTLGWATRSGGRGGGGVGGLRPVAGPRRAVSRHKRLEGMIAAAPRRGGRPAGDRTQSTRLDTILHRSSRL